ncbi:MAG: sulfatase-like hydrolase/transferase [Flavobacteriaceae bacterium]
MKKIIHTYRAFLLLMALSLIACSSDSGGYSDNSVDPIIAPESYPNILLIIADDMGRDATFGFNEGSLKPITPHINSIKNNGITFQNFWSYPTCSPTRASIITGKYGYRTGVKWAGDVLPSTERSLQKYIKEETGSRYNSAVIGKWHLSGNNSSLNRSAFGIDYYAGLMGGGLQNYFQWNLTNDQGTNLQSGYSSKIFTDLAMDWVGAQDQPWFLWLAYNAPHTPFHKPPSIMHNQGELTNYSEGIDPMPYYLAAIEAMDFQIGRLINGLTQEERDNTIILFMGDNGTPNEVGQSPYPDNAVKGSLYQGGINVPLFVSGKGVQRTGNDYNLLTSTDLFSTIAQLAGVDSDEIHDSKSFMNLLTADDGQRAFQYSEMESPNASKWAISNGDYKLIVRANGAQELYDLVSDPYESENLIGAALSLEAIDAKTALEAELHVIRN